ncbi:unnamed protein product [Calypogeia fissa]
MFEFNFHRDEGSDCLHLRGTIVVSADSISDRVPSGRASRERDDEFLWHRRRAEEDYDDFRETECYNRRGGNECDSNSMGVEGASARDCYRERIENMTYSRPGTAGRGGHHGDNSMDRSHCGLRSRKVDNTSDRVSSQRASRERDDESLWHRRHVEEDYDFRESESYFRRGGNEYDSNSMGIEGASARDSCREHIENMAYSRPGTPGRGRHHSRERDNSMDRHLGWSSREGSVDRNWDRNAYTRKDNTSGRVSSQRASRERYDESLWHRRRVEEDYHFRESESYFRRGGNESDSNSMGIEGASARDSYRERIENMTYSRPGTPGRGRHHSRERDNSMDRHFGWSSREGSVDRNWDRNGHTRNGRTGLKAEYWLHDYGEGYDKAENLGFHFRDDGGEQPRWRHPRIWEGPPGHSQYRPGSYLDVCNARYYRRARGSLSPPSCLNAIILDFLSPSRHFEEGFNNSSHSQDKGWMYHDVQGTLHGPVALPQVEELVDSGLQQSDCVVKKEPSEDRVKLEHGRSPRDPNEFKQRSVERSVPSEQPVQPSAPCGEELPSQEHGQIENSDRDICRPGTEEQNAASVDEEYEDFHIDERVDKLMEGRTLIPGKEKEIVHEALSIASRRVQQEYESDIAVEESPRSHGGFAEIGDQWKDGEFGSEVQGLEGFGFDQQVAKVDAKPEETEVGAGSQVGMEAVSAPSEPTPRASSGEPHHSDSKQESWKWPSRGGDWKQVYVVDNSQHTKGETHPHRKLVMNGGNPLCGSKSKNLRDPRKQNQESGRITMAEPMRLQLPNFALKPVLPKPHSCAEDHNVNVSQHSVMMLKGAMTPKSQGSTPRAHLSTPVKDRSFGSVAGFKANKSGKSSSTQGLPTGTVTKSLGQAKQFRAGMKKELTGSVKNNSVTEKPGPLRVAASDSDGQLKFSSDHTVDTFDRKSKPSLPDGSLQTPRNSELQGSDPELAKTANATPLKKLFMNRSLPKEEPDSEGHDFATNSNRNGIVVAGKERSEKWSEAKESSVVTALGVPVSPALSVLTPAALNGTRSTMSHLSVTEESHDTPKHEKRLLDHSTEQASSSVHETPRDNGARMMEVEVCDGRDGPFVDGISFRLKRKALPVENGEPSKQRQKNKRRTLGKEDNESGRNPAHSSPWTHVHSSMSPLLEDLGKPSDPLEAQDQVERKVQEQNWAALKPSILYSVFRSLRGDLKTLVNAMATCKSWLAAGERYKTQLKRADLSSVHEQSIDAVLESLPGFGAGKLRRVILKGCNVSPESLGHLLRACPSISAVEIGYDEPLKELICSFPHVRWLGDQNGGQSPTEALIRKREAKHLKTRSLKVIGVTRHRIRESSSRDGIESEMHPVSDGASKARSPDGYTCVVSTVEETEINESYQDSAVTHSSDGVKFLKLNNGGAIVKSNGVSGSMNAVKQENGNSVSRLQQLKRKTPSASLRRKLDKTSYMWKPVTGAQRLLADKHSSTSVKVEHQSKSSISSLFEADKTLEKEMRLILRVMMEADSDKCFQPANTVATDVNGVTSVAAKGVDLLVIERKLKGGAYAGGKDGFVAFKEDVHNLIRIAFRQGKDKLTYSAAEKVFKQCLPLINALGSQIAGTSPTNHNNQSKLPGSRPSSKVGKGGLKPHAMLQQRPKKKRKAWDDDGVQKARFGTAKKGRQGESSSGDVDSDSDSTEYETRKVSKLKKEQSWESEVDSSDEDEEPTFMEEDEEETETEASDSDVPSESEGEDGVFEDETYYSDDDMQGAHSWGARMTKAAMVPPVTRKYTVIEEYRIVADKERVEQKMKVELPEDYEAKLQAAKDQRVDSYSHLDIPETRDFRPRKELGEEVQEQEVYGIDPYTHNLLWHNMPKELMFSDSLKQQFIEERLLLALNREASKFTGSGKAPMEYNLERVVERIITEACADNNWELRDFSEQLLTSMRLNQKDKFVAYRKGLGVVCNKNDGLEKDEFVVEFFGEVYPPWRWYEKQDGIRSLQKKDKDTTPEFYNIFYERPKGDAAGYDLLVVDAMHKANFASRLCHSCRPNCEAKITAVNNKYIIGVYTLKPIKRGEELTFDYNSVTESKEEYNNAVCLCGSQGCRGSYLNLTGSGTFEEVILKQHGLLDRHRLLLDSCSATSVTEEGLQEMRQAGLGTCLLSGLPPWVLKYAAGLVHFMNVEKTLLPAELLKDLELKVQQGMVEGCTEENAEITTEGVYNQRLQNLAITLDKVRHILTKTYKNPSLAPPPLRMLDKKDIVQLIWKRHDSVVNELLQCLAPHLPKETMSDFTQSIAKHAPHDLGTNLMQCLLWLRDELRRLPATCKARHDAAADLIHIYAYTRNFFIAEDYAVVESAPMDIHPLDLGSSRHSSSGTRVWHKTYSKEYVWGQLMGWYKQSVADPGASLAKAARGCLTLPDVSSCYAKSMQHDFRQGYGQKHRQKMISHMEEKPQQKWPTSKSWSQFWSFKNERGLFGSPMLDSVLQDKPLDDQMLQWLKSREDVFVGPWDEQ